MRFCSSSEVFVGIQERGGGVQRNQSPSLLGIWEQSFLRCLLVFRIILLGNGGRDPSFEVGRVGREGGRGIFDRYWSTEPVVCNKGSGFCLFLASR